VGFDRAGITRLQPSSQKEAVQLWLQNGDHASMEYMRRRLEVRFDPREVFPGARSAICVALQYDPLTQTRPIEGDLWPGVARYARGADYHELMKRRLEELSRRITEAFPGCSTRSYVDTGPVLERELASLAGLGAFGKNTMLLNEDIGSWFLLGELFISLELESDTSIADLCGSCSRCLEACPTGALPEPYRLDAKRCISYWTIEHRGNLPRGIRGQLGHWVFGCDQCQEACPWNSDVTEAHQPAMELPSERAELDLAGLLAIDRQEYVARFRGSPMKRAKLEGLKRNAAVAMGNSRNPRYVPALLKAMEEEVSAVVRTQAAWALGEIGGGASRAGLHASMESETEPGVRQEIEMALSRMGRKGPPRASNA
jgi:epoxyqueuosine reductase